MLRIFIVFNVSRQMSRKKFSSNMNHVNYSKPIVFLRIILHVRMNLSSIGTLSCTVHDSMSLLRHHNSKESDFFC